MKRGTEERGGCGENRRWQMFERQRFTMMNPVERCSHRGRARRDLRKRPVHGHSRAEGNVFAVVHNLFTQAPASLPERPEVIFQRFRRQEKMPKAGQVFFSKSAFCN